MTFDEDTSTITANTMAMTQSTLLATTAPAPSMATAPSLAATPAYDYKAKLDCISTEIEQNLSKHFESIFAQMEAKLDNWTKKLDDQYAEQDKINEKVAKQLGFLVDNMKKFFKYATPAASPSTPLLQGNGQS